MMFLGLVAFVWTVTWSVALILPIVVACVVGFLVSLDEGMFNELALVRGLRKGRAPENDVETSH